jgi:beta-galactosidase GanA
MKRFSPAAILCAAIAAPHTAPQLSAQTPSAPTLPHIVTRDGHHALFVDGAPYLMLSAEVHNSSAWPASLPQVWPVVDELHLNTLQVPIYWEQFEPSPGHYDTSMLHLLLTQARAHHVHLVLLWFGTWKNGSGHYTPQWIKSDESRYPHILGKDGRKVDSLSPHAPATIAADARAFAALMHALKLADPQHTVLMIQVENEIGSWGSVRDFSPTAERLIAGPVPEAALNAMHKPTGGTWRQVFGTDADEYFHAWSIATDIQQIASAGKHAYPLPMYVNVSLRNPIHPGPANTYETGGATDNVLPLWQAAAPAIDDYAVDLYYDTYAEYLRAIELYDLPNNATFVAESSNRPDYARYFFAALGHGAIGFAPFGMDRTRYRNNDAVTADLDGKSLAPYALTYGMFAPMQREIARLNFEGHAQALAEDPDVHTRTLDFGAWTAKVSFGMPIFGFGNTPPGNHPALGGAMVAQLGPNEFLIVAEHARIDFKPADPKLNMQFLAVEEGTYDHGTWKTTRIWNGDQTDYGLNLTDLPQVLRVKLATY